MTEPAVRFISEPIEVAFDQPPLLEKKPGCPDRFVWQGETYEIVAKLAEWHDYQRRGRMAQNMRPEHLARAAQHGSWGVGRDHFRVQVQAAGSGPGRVFEIYYDRAPQDADHRKGRWVLNREILP
ncbi:MAG: hypothetical protein KDE29_10850 [Anaerolineales bacterium]|nr:hypothetical protein [Anaerolineales bacterium]